MKRQGFLRGKSVAAVLIKRIMWKNISFMWMEKKFHAIINDKPDGCNL